MSLDRRLRYEDATGTGEALTAVRDWLGLGTPSPRPALFSITLPESDPATPPGPAEIPASLIAAPLLQRIERLHADLGYPPVRT